MAAHLPTLCNQYPGYSRGFGIPMLIIFAIIIPLMQFYFVYINRNKLQMVKIMMKFGYQY